MALVTAERVYETTTSQGTGTLNLGGAVAGFQSFVDGIADGNTCHYAIFDDSNWEVGRGTVTAGSPDTLSRDTVFSSSNSNAAVNWGSGTRNVINTYPASLAVLSDGDISFSGNNTHTGSETFDNLAVDDRITSSADSTTSLSLILNRALLRAGNVLGVDLRNTSLTLNPSGLISTFIESATVSNAFAMMNDDDEAEFNVPVAFNAGVTGLPVTTSFKSVELVIEDDGNGSVAHGFGVIPDIVKCSFICKTADGIFSVGDEIQDASLLSLDLTGTRGVVTHTDTTSINYQYGNNANPVVTLDQNGNVYALDLPSWRMIIRAFKFS